MFFVYIIIPNCSFCKTKEFLYAVKTIKQNYLLKRQAKTLANKSKVGKSIKKPLIRSKKGTDLADNSFEDDSIKDDFFTTLPVKPVKVKVSDRYHKEKQQSLFKIKGNNSLPSLELLTPPQKSETKSYSHDDLEQQSIALKAKYEKLHK